jgi:GNAT superfamily N-acetyltransferase
VRAVPLGPADLARVEALQAEVARGLPPGFLWPRPAGDLAAMLDGTRGATFGILEGSRLVAAGMLRLPSADHPNVGPPLGPVPEGDMPHRAAFLESTMVRPEARGRGCQRTLIEARRAHAVAAGMRWLCAGVRLANARSWANLLACGLVIAGWRDDPGWLLIGLARPLAGPELVTDPGDARRVELPDEAGHRAALDDGYLGVRLAQAAVVYERQTKTRSDTAISDALTPASSTESSAL